MAFNDHDDDKKNQKITGMIMTLRRTIDTPGIMFSSHARYALT